MAHNDSLEDRSPEIVIRKPLCWADEGSTTPDVCIERVGPDELNIVTIIGGQPANTVYAGPTSGSPSNPSFRALVPLDVRGFTAQATAQIAPGTVSETHCTTMGYSPFMWIPLNGGTFAEQACIDTATTTPTPLNTWVVARRTFFKDGGNAATQQGKNAFVSINHLLGTGAVSTIQDRALWILAENATGDSSTHYAMEGIQVEIDINGTPTFNGSPDGEISAGSFQVADTHTNSAGPPTLGINGIRVSNFREATAGTYTSCASVPCWTGIRSEFENLSTVAGASNAATSFLAYTHDATGTANAMQGYGLYVRAPGAQRFGTANYGLGIENFGVNAVDFNIASFGVNSAGTAAGFHYFQGPTALGQTIHAATGYQLDILGAVKVKAGAGVALIDLFGSTSGHAGVSVAAAAGTPNTLLLPTTTGSSGQVLRTDGANPQQLSWTTPNAGTVTSVALSLPAIISVSGSPVTTSGTLTGTLATQTANTVFAGPTTGGAAAPTFRALVAADVPLSSKIQTIRSTSNCTTGSSGHDSCTDTFSWGASFGDTNYSVTCSCVDPNIGSAGETVVFNVFSKTATQITTVTQTEHDTRTAHCTEISCVAIHD